VLQAPHCYRSLCAIWDHTELPATRQRQHSRYIDNKKHLKNVGPICHCEPLHAHSPGVATVTHTYRCPRWQRRRRQRVTEGTAMAPYNGPNDCKLCMLLSDGQICHVVAFVHYLSTFCHFWLYCGEGQVISNIRLIHIKTVIFALADYEESLSSCQCL